MNEQGSTLANDLPEPAHFVIAPVPDGAYHRYMPTIIAVYYQCEKVPHESDLARIEAVAIDPDDTRGDRMSVALFLPSPEIEEDLAYNEMQGFVLHGEEKTINLFWDNVKKVKQFVFAVTTDTFYFTCRVNAETSEVQDRTFEIRFIH